MDAENARRNLRDFLSMYNHFTETCFERCIQNLNYRIMTPQEELCTNKCVSKLINVNHRQISVYMEINPLNRRLNEMSASGADPLELQTAPPDLAQEVEKAMGQAAAAAASDSTTAGGEFETSAPIISEGGKGTNAPSPSGGEAGVTGAGGVTEAPDVAVPIATPEGVESSDR